MAQKVQVQFVDDLDGSEAASTVKFSLDGTDYEIDLNAKNSAALRKALQKYVDHARKTPRAGRRGQRQRGRASGSVNTTEIRNWAREQGIDVKDRGRVPAGVVAKFEAANTANTAA